MKKRTYRVFILLTIIAVVTSFAITVGLLYEKYAPAIIPAYSKTQHSEDSTFSIHFFNVGEGDSALVECDGHYMLIDGGNPSNSSFLYSYLQRHKIEYLDDIICTHVHADHAGGLSGALNYAKVGTAYAPVTKGDGKAFINFVKYLDKQGKGITVPSPGDSFALGSAKITIIGPVDMSLASENENNSSIVLRIVYGDTSFLFTGDAEEAEELSIVNSKAVLRSTLLKVGHHGSSTSSSKEFLRAIKPDVSIISVGKDNGYGHPHEVILERLQKFCTKIYRTDIQGEIICRSDGSSLSFTFQ